MGLGLKKIACNPYVTFSNRSEIGFRQGGSVDVGRDGGDLFLP